MTSQQPNPATNIAAGFQSAVPTVVLVIMALLTVGGTVMTGFAGL